MSGSPSSSPPHAATEFLRWFCPSYLIEDVAGDLCEMFQVKQEHLGRFRASIWFWWNTLWFLRPYVLSGQSFSILGPVMWKNYALVAVRQMRRRPLYSGINIAGLALGIASCMIMLLYVQEEMGFDDFHENADQLYRLVERRTTEDGDIRFIADTAGPVGPALEAEMPEVAQSIRIFDSSLAGRSTMRHGQNERHEGDYVVAGPSFLKAFDFPLIAGDPETALDLPLSIILTESAAGFYFGKTDVLGLTMNGPQGDYQVTGVMPDLPTNSHLQFQMVKSWATFEAVGGFKRYMDDWGSRGFITYLLMESTGDPEQVSNRLASFSADHREAEDWASRAYTIQPLNAIHFDSSYIEAEHNAGKSSRTYVYTFMLIALLIALIACINYMNLSTARAMQRAREVGLRKVVGARRSQLIGQFLGESLMMALFALIVAVGIVLLTLPAFNAFVGKNLTLDPRGAWTMMLAVITTTVLVGLLSGSYPAFYIARFNPAHVFRNLGGGGREGRLLRNGLVVTQFALSIVLIASTMVAARQFSFIQEKDLGFDESRLLVLDINSGAARTSFASMKQEFGRLAEVEAVSVSSRVPGDWKGVPTVSVSLPGGSQDDHLEATFMGVDAEFLDTYRIHLREGRNFSEQFLSDSSALLVNQTAARMLAISVSEEQALTILGANFGGQQVPLTFDARVVGIVDDFHFQSLHEPIRPIILGFRNNPVHAIDYFTLRINTADVPSLMTKIAAVQQQFDPDTPVETNFLETRLDEKYREDRRAGTVFGVATGLALLIACFGLFGLAALVAEQRTKEIGVRKALGASTLGITLRMSGAFSKLVLVAFAIAAPMAFWVTSRWLDTFAYHIDMGVGTLLASGGAALVLAWATVAYQSFRAAQTDPVKVLRND